MSEAQRVVREIEIQIEKARHMIAMGDALERLFKNEDFKNIILEDYFVNEASRVVALKADVNMQSSDKQKKMKRQIIAIGELQTHFNGILRMAERSREAIREAESVREEVLAEGLEGEDE